MDLDALKEKLSAGLMEALTKPDDGKRDTSEQCIPHVVKALLDHWVDGQTVLGRELGALVQTLKTRGDPIWANVSIMEREAAIMSLVAVEQSIRAAKKGSETNGSA
jgi:hypothetical protein